MADIPKDQQEIIDKMHWNHEIKLRRGFNEFFPDVSDDSDDPDWVDGFANHIAIEALLDR